MRSDSDVVDVQQQTEECVLQAATRLFLPPCEQITNLQTRSAAWQEHGSAERRWEDTEPLSTLYSSSATSSGWVGTVWWHFDIVSSHCSACCTLWFCCQRFQHLTGTRRPESNTLFCDKLQLLDYQTKRFIYGVKMEQRLLLTDIMI